MLSEIENRIESNFNSLSKTEKRIAEYIKENGTASCYLTIGELAKEADTSPSAITRFIKKIGYQNYQEMRLELAESPDPAETPFFPEIHEGDSAMSIATATFQNGISSLSGTLAILNQDSLMQALNYLSGCRTCGIYGLGSSAIMAEAFCQRFLRTSLNTKFFSDYHMQLMMAGTLDEKDCAVLISHTGRNIDTIRIAEVLKERNVPIVLITSNASSPLARMADVALVCVSEETKYRPEAISSSISHLLLIDTLFTLYAVKKDNDPEYFSNIRKIVNTTRQ